MFATAEGRCDFWQHTNANGETIEKTYTPYDKKLVNPTQIRNGYPTLLQYYFMSRFSWMYIGCRLSLSLLFTHDVCFQKLPCVRYIICVVLVRIDCCACICILLNGFVSIKERKSSAYRFRLQTVSTIDGSLPFRTCCAHFVLYRTTVREKKFVFNIIQIKSLFVHV